MATDLVPHKIQFRCRFPEERYTKGIAWIKEHRPELYEQFQKQQAINTIKEQSPEWQAYQQRLYDQAEKDLYAESGCKLLGIEAGATKREVRNAYRRKARKLHPDVGGDAEAFKQLYAAYRAVLKIAKD